MNPTTVLFLANDIMFISQVDAPLKREGHTVVRFDPEAPVTDQMNVGAGGVGLIDLDAKGVDPIKAATDMLSAGLPVIGVCGHTNEAAQSAAKACGITLLASRGQAHSGLEALIQKALAHKPDPDCDYC